MHPRPYLSYSQLKLLETSPEAYRRQYFEGVRMGTNRGMALGKEIAEALEHDVDTGDIEKDLVIAQMPKYEIRDQELLTSIEMGRVKIPILIKPDSLRADMRAFLEYKTGLEPWTQVKVDEDDQMLFYFTGLHLYHAHTKFAVTMAEIEGELVWAETEKQVGEDGIERPHLTGKIKRFRTSRTYRDVLIMQARMVKAWDLIGKMMEEEIV